MISFNFKFSAGMRVEALNMNNNDLDNFNSALRQSVDKKDSSRSATKDTYDDGSKQKSTSEIKQGVDQSSFPNDNGDLPSLDKAKPITDIPDMLNEYAKNTLRNQGEFIYDEDWPSDKHSHEAGPY